MGHTSKDFFGTKMGPMCNDFYYEKLTHWHGTSLYAVTFGYPLPGTLLFKVSSDYKSDLQYNVIFLYNIMY